MIIIVKTVKMMMSKKTTKKDLETYMAFQWAGRL
jgi:DNA-binding Xre family transcriptional regulator